jgi:hypothetical protein
MPTRDGKVRSVRCDVKAFRPSVASALCALGGDAGWTLREPSKADPTAEIAVVRYSKPDEAGDLDVICAPYPELVDPSTGKAVGMSGQPDGLQRAKIRMQVLEESLTSRKWRLWVRDFPSHRAASVAALRDAAQAAHRACESEWTSGKLPNFVIRLRADGSASMDLKITATRDEEVPDALREARAQGLYPSAAIEADASVPHARVVAMVDALKKEGFESIAAH